MSVGTQICCKFHYMYFFLQNVQYIIHAALLFTFFLHTFDSTLRRFKMVIVNGGINMSFIWEELNSTPGERIDSWRC